MENENILIMKDLDVRLFTDRGELPVIKSYTESGGNPWHRG